MDFTCFGLDFANIAFVLMIFTNVLESLIFQQLQKNIPEDQIPGQVLSRLSERMIKSDRMMRSDMREWTSWISGQDVRLSNGYREWLKEVKCQAQSRVSKNHNDIHAIFFEICEALEIPAELLDRGILVETLTNVFMYIVRMSDELRLTDHESPDFLEILKRYKQIVDAFCKLKFDKFFFRSDEELQLFFERMDEKLQLSGKGALSEHKFSSITSLLISTDFVMAGFLKPVPNSEDFLRLIVFAIMQKYVSCVRTSLNSKHEADSLVEELCNIFEDSEKHPFFCWQDVKLNLLCKLLPWKEFTDFLKMIRVRNPVEHKFICLTMIMMAKTIKEDTSERIDEQYAHVLSHYPSCGFVTDRAQILEFVCGQLSITPDFGQD
jgi:hypothetical protein